MKKFIKKLHLYVALVLCLPLILQGLSGAILVIAEVVEQSPKSVVETSKIIFAAQKKVPQNFSPSFIKISDGVATIRFSKKPDPSTSSGQEKQLIQVKINPVSLEILEISDPKKGFFAFVKKFHTNLFIEGQTGRNIVGVWGLAILFMLITGLILWYPKKDRPYTFKFKFSSVGKKFHRDIHAAVGFWTLILVFVSSFSGLYLAYPKTVSKIILSTPSFNANEIKIVPAKNSIGIDEAIKLASQGLAPEEKFIAANLPMKPNQPFRINFSYKNYHYGEPPIAVFVDQYRKKIIEKRDPRNFSGTEKIISWQHAVHTGEAFGLWWKILIFLNGFLPLLFSITGIMMWWIKRFGQKIPQQMPLQP